MNTHELSRTPVIIIVALVAVFSLAICLLFAPGSSARENTLSGNNPDFTTIEWLDLLPQADLAALSNPPTYVTEVESGSLEDQISGQIQNTIRAATDDRYQQALASTDVIAAMDGQRVRIPGFIVPLEFDDEQTITQFFLVPYFGACIHMPPPPPNQIILVTYPEGFKLSALYDPFWISGVLRTTVTANDLATSAYSLTMYHHAPYTEPY